MDEKINNMFSGSELPKFRGSPNIFLTKYQLSGFSVKTDFEELKKKVNKIWLKTIFGDPRNFGGSDPMNELNGLDQR